MIKVLQFDNEIDLSANDLMAYYLTYVNDYLTLDRFSQDMGIDPKELQEIINLGKKLYNAQSERVDFHGVKAIEY